MKTFAKEMWHLLVFAAALIAFNAGLSILFDSWVEWFGGDLTLKSALFLTVVQVGLGLLALKTFEWLHKHVAETRGMKYFKEAVDKHGEELRGVHKQLGDKLLEYEAANKQLSEANHTLVDALDRANARIHYLSSAYIPAEEQHFDDWALDQFVVQMRAKLKRKRDEGHSGWNDCALDLLGDAFVEQIESMNASNTDMVDTANFAMFLWVRDAFPAECAEQNPDAHELPATR
uniref:Uncharacterized protein n=1 Tax=Pseudomonas phage Nican01 TaxID=3138540 RepID=A0AAU6W0Q2_9CAUD